ncbi:hypothetical protein [Paraburkholderia saeva]|uniref:Uncharacterized protein n=1 Tax=Paraburkholderia saeva TaxID=2777537 RepID=A0A9N8RX86_9BURK|nr:hypothetical protein [Paraburkholderia saeva]CAG4900985.1 hypothetical protein LMG31841_02940 [Paraburkholderia saeva]
MSETNSASAPMTTKERDTLREAVRLRARVAKADIDKRAAMLRAETEAQLSARYKADDDRWAKLVDHAARVGREADAELLRICKAEGIPLENRPSFRSGFVDRGDYSLPARRAELRKLAASKIDLAVKDAKLSVERWQAQTQTELLAGLLGTDDAKAFLAALPSPEALLPGMTAKQIDGLLESNSSVLRLVMNDSTGTDDE